MVQIDRLRLFGFKSFVEATELLVAPGLTGIVGPNGCGKSNLVEALRWVMGEASAKRLRGHEMDDVIFSGTAERPGRSIAEVTLHLDNGERAAPAPFNDSDEIEVTRRIERDSGSTYRVNRREVRARDVQLLFADAATGAHSAAQVGQGEVSSLIRMRPADRRAILEEAAGITGLHARRHEAELRLRAADSNLERLDDVMATLEGQLQALKRQARQATRYRNLSGHIRRAEAVLLHHAWSEAAAQLSEAGRLLAAAEGEVVEFTRKAADTSRRAAEATDALPELRQTAAESAARLHHLVVARQGLDAEEARIADDRAKLEALLRQIDEDRDRADSIATDVGTAISGLDEERARLEAAVRDQTVGEREAGERLASEAAIVDQRDRSVRALSERVVAEEGQRRRLAEDGDVLERRLARMGIRIDELSRERDALMVDGDAGDSTEPPIAAIDAAAQSAQAALRTAEQQHQQAQQEVAAARQPVEQHDAAAAGLKAEDEALARLLGEAGDELWPPLIDAVTVGEGFEAALGAALGDDLNASGDEAAPAHWCSFAPLGSPPELPAGAEPLSRHVTGPPALARRLSQVGVVDDKAGPRLQVELAQGQRLVSRGGALWRWDGYAVAAGAATGAAARLNQRNRLRQVRHQRHALAAPLAAAHSRLATARAVQNAATELEATARDAARQESDALAAARQAEAAAGAAAARRGSRLAVLNDALDELTEERRGTQAEIATASHALEQAADAEATRRDLAAAEAELGSAREAVADTQRAHARAHEQAQARRDRLDAVVVELESWAVRAQSANEQFARLEQRRGEIEAGLARLADKPADIQDRRRALLSEIDKAEAAQRRASDALVIGEDRSAACGRDAKSAESALALAREDRVRREAATAQATERRDEAVRGVRDRLDCPPEEALAKADLKQEEAVPDVETVTIRLDRLHRERDTMGPVNLRADIETAEIGEKLQTMRDERADLEAAIARLRQGIGRLNRQGRERVLAAFDGVDGHFRELFARLFGGGRAHLALVDSDDPLEAGLEIMASPPGRRLSVLSLLSGGEQALTALALIFAVFLTNPAPICVLDEVDAALDDANADRLLSLIEDIATETGTRFLMVTHNPLSMARMDRLYGVTMRDLGVSEIVSVDLVEAEALRATG